MDYFPILMKLNGRRILVCGTTGASVFKIRLLLKTSAKITVFGTPADDQIKQWSKSGLIEHVYRSLNSDDCNNAAFAYVSLEDSAERNLTLNILTSAGIPCCVIDDKERSDFITPAVVNRDPITIAVGSEGTSPVLARHIKAQIEDMLPQETGLIAKVAGAFRHHVNQLPKGHGIRRFWNIFFTKIAPNILSQSRPQDHEIALELGLHDLMKKEGNAENSICPVQFVGAGPGDPDLLTRKAAKALHEGDIILYDRLTAPEILELCRREANLIEVGKSASGPSWMQEDINRLLVSKAKTGKRVIRLKSGDAGIFGRLDEEIEALHQAGLPFEIIPGITTAAAAAADMGVSLTRRGRNGQLRLLTGHDINGFADHDWRSLALNGSVASIYMGVRAIPYIQGRLLMHGASGDMPVTVGQNVGRKNAIWIASNISTLAVDCQHHGITGPAILMLGLHPHNQRTSLLSEKSINSMDTLDNDLISAGIFPQLAVLGSSAEVSPKGNL